jgi:hypothetical protein
MQKKTYKWTNIGELKTIWKCFSGVNIERLMILDAIWKKETGNLSKYVEIMGIKRSMIVVKVHSAVAHQELSIRSRDIIKSLNKHFNRPWIKFIRISNEF